MVVEEARFRLLRSDDVPATTPHNCTRSSPAALYSDTVSQKDERGHEK
jgi:hypothetical protein